MAIRLDQIVQLPKLTAQYKGIFLATLGPILWALYTLLLPLLAFTSSPVAVCFRTVAIATTLLLVWISRNQFRDLCNLLQKGALVRSVLLSSVAYLGHLLVFYPAVMSGYKKAASLGMFFSVIAGLVLAYVILEEPIKPSQKTYIFSSLVAISLLFSLGIKDWLSLLIALTVGGSFALVILARKYVAKKIDTLTLVTIETLLLEPIALAFLLYQGSNQSLNFSITQVVLLLGIGSFALLPIWLQAEALNPKYEVPMTLISCLNLLSPLGQFLLAACVFRQETIVYEWLALILLAGSLIRFNISNSPN